MASHGIARTNRPRTVEQRQQEVEKIARYRDLEEQFRSLVRASQFTPELLQLTTKLLRLNPEYYTAWNGRRRALRTSGLSSRRSASSWRSRASPSFSRSATTTPSSAASCSSSSTTTPRGPRRPTTGPSGTTAEGGGVPEAEDADADADADADVAAAADEQTLRAELAFTMPLLLEHPKCYWLWNHRRWALTAAVSLLAVGRARAVWLEELGLINKMLARDRRNFHAWGYRRAVVERLEREDLAGTSMVEDEFDYTTRMINADLSNMSAWHRRSTLIPRLLDERGADDEARKAFFFEELGMIREALNVGPEDQSLWVYHGFLMRNLTESVRSSTATFAPNLSESERVTILTQELSELRELLEDYDDQKLIYKALVAYTRDLAALEGARGLEEDERADVVAWIARLKQLDPMREGAWIDVERDLDLTRFGSRMVSA